MRRRGVKNFSREKRDENLAKVKNCIRSCPTISTAEVVRRTGLAECSILQAWMKARREVLSYGNK